MADNECVFCGDVIPEGRQVCPNCEATAGEPKYDADEFLGRKKKHKVYCVTKILMHIGAEVEYFQRRIPDAELSIQMTQALYFLLAAAHQAIVSTPAGDTLYGLKVKVVRGVPGLRYWISVYDEGFTSEDYQEVWV